MHSAPGFVNHRVRFPYRLSLFESLTQEYFSMSIVKSHGRRGAPVVSKSSTQLVFALLVALAGVGVAVAPGPAAGQEPTPQGNDPRPVGAPPPLTVSTGPPSDYPEGEPLDDLEAREPPDGKWLKSEDGRDYFVTRLKKTKGTVFRASKTEIVYKRIYPLELDHEDAQYWYIRYYRADEGDLAIEKTQEQEQERLAKVKESYEVDEHMVDRLVFAPYDAGLPRKGQWRQGLAVADINRDGHLDIVHGPPRKGDPVPQIYLGDGAGNWRLWTEAKFPDIGLDYGDIAVGDVDGDGLLDLALGIHLRGVRVLRQTSPGIFADWSKGLPFDRPGRGGDASGFASRAVELVDWNGDKKLDLIALGEGPRQTKTTDGKTRGLPGSSSYGLVVFLNEGSKGWRALSHGETGGVFGDSIAVGNWNSDKRPDVVTVSYNLGSRDLLQLNSGKEEVASQVNEIPTIRKDAWVFGVVAADFDGDKRDDVITSFATYEGDVPRRGLELSRRDAKGQWHTDLLVAYEGKDNLWSLAHGDVDGDGRQDLVATTERGNVLVFLGDGKGHFIREESPEIDPPTLCRGYGLELADLDGDGRDEIVAGFAGEAETILEFLGTTKCETGGALRVWKASPRAGS
jgi:hypothetical protein